MLLNPAATEGSYLVEMYREGGFLSKTHAVPSRSRLSGRKGWRLYEYGYSFGPYGFKTIHDRGWSRQAPAGARTPTEQD